MGNNRSMKQDSVRSTVDIPVPLYRTLIEQAVATGRSIRLSRTSARGVADATHLARRVKDAGGVANLCQECQGANSKEACFQQEFAKTIPDWKEL
jgi:hypothetical protein